MKTLEGDGIVLRPWRVDDVSAMIELFDTAEMDRWTPLAHPFDEEAATDYVRRAHAGPGFGTLQYAITVGGSEPLGEVILFPAGEGVCEVAYAVGVRHRGRQLAARAVRLVLSAARGLGYREAMLTIARGNVGSEKVALACGFTRTAEPLRRRERKGHVLDMATWRRVLGPRLNVGGVDRLGDTGRVRVRVATMDDVTTVADIRRRVEEWLDGLGIRQWPLGSVEESLTPQVAAGEWLVGVDPAERIVAAGQYLDHDPDIWPDDTPGEARYLHGFMTNRGIARPGDGAAFLRSIEDRARTEGARVYAPRLRRDQLAAAAVLPRQRIHRGRSARVSRLLVRRHPARASPLTRRRSVRRSMVGAVLLRPRRPRLDHHVVRMHERAVHVEQYGIRTGQGEHHALIEPLKP